MQLRKKEWQWLAGVWLMWRVGTFVLSWMADAFFKYAPSFPYAEQLLPAFDLPRWLYSWANFDGVHYITIAEKGYIGTGLIQAFFPVYPLGVGVLQTVLSNTLLLGISISSLLSILLIFAWYGLAKSVLNEKAARIATMLLLLFPTSFFLGALYTESLFLLLMVLSWWCLDQKKWWPAAFLIAGAAATRVVGIGLVVPYLWAWWQAHQPSRRWQRAAVVNLLPLIVTPMGLGAYMWFLYGEFNDPLYFLHVQSEFGAGRQESLVLYPQVVWRYIKILLTYRPIDWKYFAFVQEFVAGVGGLTGLGWAFKKEWLGWWLFSLLAFLLPTTTGTFSSMPRYILVCLPIFLIAAEWLTPRPKLRWLVYAISASLLILNTLLFIQGYWVA